MVIEFLPAVASTTGVSSRTALEIALNLVVRVPELTCDRFEVKEEGAFEVLPVVSVDAVESFMFDLDRAKFRLEAEKKESETSRQQMKRHYFQLEFGVRVSAHLSVRTRLAFGKLIAIFSLVVFGMVNLFNERMGLGASLFRAVGNRANNF